MTDLFVGLGFTALIAVFAYLFFLAISWIIAVIRVATNKKLSGGSKALWILLSIFIPGGASLYFVFKDKSKFLTFMGWLTLAPTLMAIGYFAASSFDPSPLLKPAPIALPSSPPVQAAPIIDTPPTPEPIPAPEAGPPTDIPQPQGAVPEVPLPEMQVTPAEPPAMAPEFGSKPPTEAN